MRERTRTLWGIQEHHPGDRERLFRAVAGFADLRSVLYPGSWVDVAASFVWPEVTYVDSDRRARQFFEDADGVDELLAEGGGAPTPVWHFLARDYTDELPLADAAYDLLVSLYAGLVSEHCTQHLRVGGLLVANSSHGDVAMAHLDERYELVGVVARVDEGYRVRTDELERHLVPKKPGLEVTPELVRSTGRGIAYTTAPAAYLFRRVR